MKFFRYVFLFINLLSVAGLSLSKNIRYDSIINNIQKKTKGITELIRPSNILPTLALTSASGWIMNSNILRLLSSRQFIASNFIVLSIMSNSMIINDLFDTKIDMVNNPDRPLINGEIKKHEALSMSAALLIISEALNYKYIPQYLQNIPRIANVIIVVYTPILKRILLIKNLSCSLLISLSVLFTGLSSLNNTYFIYNRSFILLSLVAQIIFTGSFYCEVLLDISDIEGDRNNKIYTVPGLLGEKEAVTMIGNVTILNIFWCAVNMSCMFNFGYGILLFYICFPLIKNLMLVTDNNYSKESIKQATSATIKPMVFTLIYLCIMSRRL
jgi:4-hydroxybenzoate polyprenyltransferase